MLDGIIDAGDEWLINICDCIKDTSGITFKVAGKVLQDILDGCKLGKLFHQGQELLVNLGMRSDGGQLDEIGKLLSPQLIRTNIEGPKTTLQVMMIKDG